EEPLARLQEWPRAYSRVGGILYHSREEQELAQSQLGVNHPGGMEIGTYLPMREPVSERLKYRFQPEKAGSPTRSAPRYLVYCGRYSGKKELLRLLEFAVRYQAIQPGRFAFVFMGRGEVAIPKQGWAHDLGQVDENVKRAVLAGAAALIQLSRQESLSLVALE